MTRIYYDSKEVVSAKARELTELVLTRSDIEHAISSLETIVSAYLPAPDKPDPDEPPSTGIIRLSLFRDAVVQFAGCFGSGRFKINEKEIYTAETGQLEYFNWIKDLRDTFAAHAFGPSRQCIYVAAIDAEGVVKIAGPGAVVYQGPMPEEYAVIAGFMRIALSYVEHKINIVGSEVEKQVKAMSPAELRALPNASMTIPGPEDLRKSRSDFKSGKSPGRRG